jgi:hypothetical protein
MPRPSNPQPGQEPLPVQPVERPILCSPYQEPSEHWGALNLRPDQVEDIYFTGGLHDPRKTDFYVEYRRADGKWHRYSPDFVIRRKDGRSFPKPIWDRIRLFGYNLSSLPVWVNNELSSTVFGGKQNYDFWQMIFETGHSPQGLEVLSKPLDLMEMIKE